jgi:hypothetical protein
MTACTCPIPFGYEPYPDGERVFTRSGEVDRLGNVLLRDPRCPVHFPPESWWIGDTGGHIITGVIYSGARRTEHGPRIRMADTPVFVQAKLEHNARIDIFASMARLDQMRAFAKRSWPNQTPDSAVVDWDLSPR